MDIGSIAAPAAGTAHTLAPRPVLVAVPFFRNEHLAASVADSLLRCTDDLHAAGAEAVFYNDSPDYPKLRDALTCQAARIGTAFPLRISENTQNLGFLRTMNQAVAEAVARGMDLLMLNSDAELEPGALPEMIRVAGTDHMIGFVNPRSNNATIATLPLPAGAEGRDAQRAAYETFAARLPPVSFIPTAVGFCMLVRWRVLAEFGGFDEIYGKGYNEENDLVMRAGRCGFRAVLANHAFAWHEGEASFSSADISRNVWEPRNRALLDQRYPEYGPHTHAYYHTPEALAERLLALTLPGANGRLSLAFDFSSFRADHNGTFQAGYQLLREAHAAWGGRFDIYVICAQAAYDFHGYAGLGIPRLDPHGDETFSAIFRVGQPYDWNALERIATRAPVIGLYMLDTISVDCPQLATALLVHLWQFAFDHADLIVTQSRQTHAQFNQRFAPSRHLLQTVSPHSLDVADYRLPGMAGSAPTPGQILVLGNHFHHKYLPQTANALAEAFPDRTIIAMGPNHAGVKDQATAPPPLARRNNLHPLAVGALTDDNIGRQYAAAEIVVFPSHAEGFGFPALHALAAQRPLFLRRLPVFQEIWEALGRTPNMHFYDSTAELIDRLRTPPPWQPHDFPSGQGAARSAAEIAQALDQALAGASYPRIVSRIRATQLIADNGQPRKHANGETDAAKAAAFLAQSIEKIARRVLGVKAVYAVTRAAFRVVKGRK
jgi:GT2 family glycosyltransferase